MISPLWGTIDQIRRKEYVFWIQGYTGEILLAGINYDRKSKKHSCMIEGFDKWRKNDRNKQGISDTGEQPERKKSEGKGGNKRGKGKQMRGNYGQAEFTRDYNATCGRIFQEERRRRKVSLEEIASGILSKTALGKMESGRAGWRKLEGDTLFQRLGISPDYFEMVASGDELGRWRLREDICLLIPDRAAEAEEKIREYRKRYTGREPLEEQFLRKAEVLLLLKDWEENARGKELRDGGRLLDMAEEAVSCTVIGDWENDLDGLHLAPSELEAVLLAGAARMVCGRETESREIQRAVWEYPERHGWKERLTVLIRPQAALLGMELALRQKDYRGAFLLGREALELLRRNAFHCYLMPLLDRLDRIPGEELKEEEREYLREAAGFRTAFQEIYARAGYPAHRIWQGIGVENTREAGIVLKMLRKFAGKPRAAAVRDEDGMAVVTQRQLEKIEKGEHKPSYENYRRLVRQYGKNGGWMAPMLETDSAEVLELRQEIATLVGLREREKAEEKMELLRRKVNPEYPRVRQEFLLYEALRQKKHDLEKSLELLRESLHVTVPDMEGKDGKWWVFQREEGMIATNIMDVCRKLGKMKEAGEWFEMIRFSMEQQKIRTGIVLTGYSVLMGSYDNYLGELERFEEAAEASKEAALNYLKRPQINTLASALYRFTWNTHEIAKRHKERREVLQKKWENAFLASEAVAVYTNNNFLISFLNDRRDQYLV